MALRDKVVVVTGGASGIGRATALAAAAEGVSVAVVDHAAEGGEETARLIAAAGGAASWHVVDVTSWAELDACLGDVARAWGRIDGLFNNAGINGPTKDILEYSEEEWDRVIAVNLKGVWLGIKAVVPHLRRAGGGSIVNTGSTASLIGYATLGGYVAAKHGVLGLTRSAAIEYASERIRVNCVCPGPVDTPLMRGIEETLMPGDAAAARAFFAGTTALKRYAEPQEIAGLVLFLLSDEASYLTGAAYSIDAGVTAGH